MPDCVFCQRIERGECVMTGVDGVRRFEPLNPVTPGHMLFVPVRHAASAFENPRAAGACVEAAARYGVGGAYNIITSHGAAATQTVFHLHVHLVPRRPNDGLALPWTGQVRPATEAKGQDTTPEVAKRFRWDPAENCYCDGPEEIYPHRHGTGRHCRPATDEGTREDRDEH